MHRKLRKKRYSLCCRFTYTGKNKDYPKTCLNFVRFDFEHVLCILHEHDSAQFGHFDHIRIDSMHESI